jgi:hypothetical protein
VTLLYSARAPAAMLGLMIRDAALAEYEISMLWK